MSDCLVLNADGAPISFLPISTIIWQEAIKYLVLDKCHVLEWHDHWIVRSAKWETKVPSVIILKEYMKTKTTVRFSKSNVFLRDRYICQYCNNHLEKKSCTLDHVTPISKGGKSVFENSVTACSPCNAKKGSETKMKPKTKPHRPTFYELVNKRKELPLNFKHNVWMEYIK